MFIKNLLVTGGAGFIGSHFIENIAKTQKYNILNLDCLSYATSQTHYKRLGLLPNYKFIQGNILNRALLERIFKDYSIDAVINFAAQTHVDKSIKDPIAFTKTNVLGTNNLIDISFKHIKSNKAPIKFIQISTDEVYGPSENGDVFDEQSPLLPNNPYSASKAAADCIVRSYIKTYNFPAVITRSVNNYGLYQHKEKLIPKIISCALHNKKIPIYGDGLQKRSWISVDDNCSAIQYILENGDPGEVYNISGNTEITNLELTKIILGILQKPLSLIEHVTDRPGHDRAYSVNSAKLKNLGWEATTDFYKSLKQIIVDFNYNDL